MFMAILLPILEFIGTQLLKAVLTAQAVKDATLAILKAIATHTKTKFDDHIYNKVKFYMFQDKSERIGGETLSSDVPVPPDLPEEEPPKS